MSSHGVQEALFCTKHVKVALPASSSDLYGQRQIADAVVSPEQVSNALAKAYVPRPPACQ